MPPFTAKVISDQELEAIYAFLQSRPMPPPVKDIPLLAPSRPRAESIRSQVRVPDYRT
jgi:hypothetical protein